MGCGRALLVRLKAVDELRPVHTAQLLTYMKLSGIGTGLLLNFNVRRMKDGIKRFKLCHYTAESAEFYRHLSLCELCVLCGMHFNAVAGLQD